MPQLFGCPWHDTYSRAVLCLCPPLLRRISKRTSSASASSAAMILTWCAFPCDHAVFSRIISFVWTSRCLPPRPSSLASVQVSKPLGIILEEDKNGDVFIAEVPPNSNGARAGLKPGEKISMVSATFGNELWSVKGAGLTRVMKAIKVRIGTSVSVSLRVHDDDHEDKRQSRQGKGGGGG